MGIISCKHFTKGDLDLSALGKSFSNSVLISSQFLAFEESLVNLFHSLISLRSFLLILLLQSFKSWVEGLDPVPLGKDEIVGKESSKHFKTADFEAFLSLLYISY